MVGVTIDSGPISATHQLREVPREKWHDLMLARRQFMEIHMSHDCRCLVEFVNDASEMYSALGFDSIEAMIRNGYHLQPEEIDIAVEWLRLNPPDQPISLTRAVTLGQRGGDRRSEKVKDQMGNAHLKGNGSIERTVARLERDGHTDLAANVREGKISANAAAIEVGIRKRPASAFEQVMKLLPKLTADERQELITELSGKPGRH